MTRLALMAVALLLAGCAHRRPFEFALIGDMPYSDEATTNSFPNLINEINAAKVEFVIHDGDIKAAATPCTDALFQQRLQQFQTFEHPLFYIFGDNEWQDCSNPMERLARLRELFIIGDRTLGRRTMGVTRQSSAYPENIQWTHRKILFAGFNMPGAANNFGKPEFAARNEANCLWLRETFARAKTENCRGIMLVIQANPSFDRAATNDVRRGFNQWLGILQEEVTAFRRPVVLVHGDSHYFRIDKPLLSHKTGRRIPHFTRVETFGNPDVHWLRARVDPRDPNLFSFHIELVPANLPEY